MKITFNIELFILQLIAIIILVFIIFQILKVIKSYKLEKRIAKYGIDSLNNTTNSIFDIIIDKYNRIIKSISLVLKKSHIIKKYSKKYNQYITYFNSIKLKAIDFVSIKIIIIITFLLIIVISNIFRYREFTFIQLFTSFILGFFLPDIFLLIKKSLRKKKIDEDMLKAIIIMNNAFKSGRTTMQAIEIVKNEINGPMGEEFNKMYTDISFGLSLDVVFERFAKRINTDDARYITASLAILNKTGGDIVKVFSSIERSFFNRRKLKNELRTLTASSNVMFKFLIIAPFIIFLVIFFLNPTYFKPFISTTPGLIISGLIIILFIIYIYLVKRVMKIKV